MKSLGDGRIVNITSTLRDGIPGPSDTLRAPLPYVTAKSALVGFTRQLAIELGPFGISVNAVAPGLTLPDENARLTQRFRALPEEVQKKLTSTIALGRPAIGTDIANMVCFLAQPRGAYVSGQVISVSGGPWA
jgi:NAD(P)-dependent dehydrogenase (short-subunit alcohol dehydrogenase family)